MERESFEDEATASYLNANFIPIKVDREERPDLDQIYMGAVQAMTGGGGWPMSVFLTPEGRPFYGGTYFPDAPRHGMPSFRDVLEGVNRAFTEQRPEVEGAGVRLVDALVKQQTLPGGGPLPSQPLLEAATSRIEATFDAHNGGWGTAPKFPQPMTIEFLLRRHVATGDQRPLAMARRSLDAMADGGIRDQLGGGFHRYSTDAEWLVPHFEQMLYDNAQLARVYTHAWQLTGDTRYRDVASATLEYVLRELRRKDGTFAASQDADTEGEEGATFVWTAAEIRDVLGDESAAFADYFDATETGNWEGRTILRRIRPPASDDVEARLAASRERLAERRRARPQPARDDKALAAWNGLAIGALADAGRQIDPRYAGSAAEAAEALLAGLRTADGRLKRSWKDGRAVGEGVLEDYAHLGEGLLALYEATFDERWFVAARDLADQILAHFADPAGGFFDTADDHERLVTRPRDPQDNAVPSGGSMAAMLLLKLAALTGEGRYREAAELAIGTVTTYVADYPTGFANWLTAIDFALAPVVEIAIVGDIDATDTHHLLKPVQQGFRPNQVLAASPAPERSAVPLLANRVAIDGKPTVYVCRNFACRLPVTDPKALLAELAG
jgi:hypothetical protein